MTTKKWGLLELPRRIRFSHDYPFNDQGFRSWRSCRCCIDRYVPQEWRGLRVAIDLIDAGVPTAIMTGLPASAPAVRAARAAGVGMILQNRLPLELKSGRTHGRRMTLRADRLYRAH